MTDDRLTALVRDLTKLTAEFQEYTATLSLQPREVNEEPAPAAEEFDDPTVSCPTCGGRMWDNRCTKKNPKAPDYKCRDRSCAGVIWPPR
jgi:hypothetical protein